jgi:hypothetical protein
MQKTITLDGKKYTGKALVKYLLIKGLRANAYGYLVWRDGVILIPWQYGDGQRNCVGCGFVAADGIDIDEIDHGVRSLKVSR